MTSQDMRLTQYTGPAVLRARTQQGFRPLTSSSQLDLEQSSLFGLSSSDSDSRQFLRTNFVSQNGKHFRIELRRSQNGENFIASGFEQIHEQIDNDFTQIHYRPAFTIILPYQYVMQHITRQFSSLASSQFRSILGQYRNMNLNELFLSDNTGFQIYTNNFLYDFVNNIVAFTSSTNVIDMLLNPEALVDDLVISGTERLLSGIEDFTIQNGIVSGRFRGQAVQAFRKFLEIFSIFMTFSTLIAILFSKPTSSLSQTRRR